MRKQKWTTPEGDCYRLYRDMLDQPHLMVAGETGSGKSVVINALIYTALYGSPADTPRGAQFILIDPKRIELLAYRELPHTLRYASEPEEMVQAIQYAMQLVEARYRTMQAKGCKRWPGSQVYLIIDEFADLMLTNRKQVQPLIQRLAQIARAACVHIILATQCPLAKVIPTEIKVNFDARLALRTATAQHSRNIMEQTGCELLPLYGKGFYMRPGEMKLYNIPMISDADIAERVQWWLDQKPKNLLSRLFCGTI